MAMTLSPGSATLTSAYVNSSLLCESNFTPTATTAFSSQQLHFTTGCLQSDVVSFPQKSVTPTALAFVSLSVLLRIENWKLEIGNWEIKSWLVGQDGDGLGGKSFDVSSAPLPCSLANLSLSLSCAYSREMRQGRKVCWGGWVWVGGWLAMVAMGNGGEENGWLRAGFWVLGGGGIKEMEDREVTLGSGFV